MIFKLKLSGRSGCEIGLIERDGLPIVRKYSKSISYNQRLVLQAEKQSAFSLKGYNSIFNTPAILNQNSGNEENLAWIEMKYIHAEKYSDYLERMSIPDLEKLAMIFRDY